MNKSAYRHRWLEPPAILLLALAACGGPDTGGERPSASGPCVSTALVVCTQSGKVQGASEGNLRAFRGIPFAAPPVGKLRWRPPQPPASWQGIRDATLFGNRCPQVDPSGQAVGNEDCLTLNVYAVNPAATTMQPVLVFIHGGGAIAGSAQDAPWGVPPPIAEHGVIVVTVQYRLGLLGFLVSPELSAEADGNSGDYALMDLVAALHWVHDNIREFGGDPARVTIDGHSWGSVNVESLLAMPSAAGLFSAAVMESGVLKGGLIGTSIDDSYRWYADVPAAVGCDTAADLLACLRALPAETLVQSVPNSADTGWVNVDPDVLPEDPFLKLQRLGSPVPLLIGSNSEEMAYPYVFSAPLDADSYAAAIHAQFDPWAAGSGDTILSLYPAANYTNANYAQTAVETDHYYGCNTRNLARAASGDGRPKVWRYLFTHRYENPAPQDQSITDARAFHGAETFFVTGNFQSLWTSVPYTPSSAETALANEMMDYWARFAATGDPNGSGAQQWLAYDASDNIQQLDDNITTLTGGYENAQCDFLDTMPLRFF